jgi:hypothetical protein
MFLLFCIHTPISVKSSPVTPLLHSFRKEQRHAKYISHRRRSQSFSPIDVLLASSTTTTTVRTFDTAPTTASKNVVVSLCTYVKDSVLRTATSCGQLYTNHQRCNAIRKKQSAYRAQLQEQWEQSGSYEHYSSKQVQQLLARQPGGISYEEYIFLQRGKEDRGKVLNMGFLMWGAPRILPYALMFNKNMLPSPFLPEEEDLAGEVLRRERTRAILNTLLVLESKMVAVSGNFFTNLLSSKASATPAHEVVRTIVAETSQVLGGAMKGSTESARAMVGPIWQRMEPLLYRTGTDFTRAEKRLCPVPPCIVQGLTQAVFGGSAGLLAQLTPAFLQRGKLVGHLEKVQAADEFLLQIDLATIPQRLLHEACQERLIDTGSHRSTQDLRLSLADWLHLTAPQPPALDAGTAVDDATVYYNGHLARLVLMAYYGCAAVRDAHAISRLPQLLYCGGNATMGL